MEEVAGGLEPIVQRQVVYVTEGRAPDELCPVRRKNVADELGHELLRVLRPHPIALLALGHSMLDRSEDVGVQHVRLVVQLLDETQRERPEGMRLFRLLEELDDPPQKDQELGVVAQNLLVLRTIDVCGELKRLVKLVVQLLDECNEKLLQLFVRAGILGIVFGVAGVLLRGHKHWQHLHHPLESHVPKLDAHRRESPARVVEVRGDHRGVDVKLRARALFDRVRHQVQQFFDVGGFVEAFSPARLRNLEDLFHKFLRRVFVGLVRCPLLLPRAVVAATLLVALAGGLVLLRGLGFFLLDFLLLKLKGSALLVCDKPTQHFLLTGRVFVAPLVVAVVAFSLPRLAFGTAGVAARRRAVRAVRAVRGVRTARGGTVRIAVGIAVRPRRRRRVAPRCLLIVGVASGVVVILTIIAFGLELIWVLLEFFDPFLVGLVALAHLRAQRVEGALLILRKLRATLLLIGVVLLGVRFQTRDRPNERVRRPSIRVHEGLELVQRFEECLVISDQICKVVNFQMVFHLFDAVPQLVVPFIGVRLHDALPGVLFLTGRFLSPPGFVLALRLLGRRHRRRLVAARIRVAV
mmetsp:Transcript_62854/g.175130  ORF Transcript_62854/g.175130 Transcript_62854/m.175130 type:complete len:579 (-) Transcript_62854:152-1888(-)